MPEGCIVPCGRHDSAHPACGPSQADDRSGAPGEKTKTVMRMGYQLLADLVVLLHAGFVLFAVLGGILVLRRRALAWVHVPAVMWAAYIELSGGLCPLTPLENWLRMRGDAEGYAGDFLGHYLQDLLYPGFLTRTIQLVMGIGVVAINVLIYVRVLRKQAAGAGSGRGGHTDGPPRTRDTRR
jgi:hypothetical protein